MKKRNILFLGAALLLSSFMILQFGCKKDNDKEPEAQPTDELILSEDVVEIDTILMGSPVIEGDNYTFTDNGNLPQFEVGDIIVGNTGYGYMRIVTNITNQGDDVILTTSQATLEDVIENCVIKDSIKLTLDKAIYKGQEYPAMVVFIAKGVKISKKGGIDLSGFQIFSGTYSGVDVTAQIDQGSINFEPVYTREIEIRLFKLKHLRLSSSGDLDFTCDATIMVDAPVSLEKEKLVAQIYFGPFPFGPVPLFIVLTFNAGINANLDITGSIGNGFDTEAYLEYGADYSDSQWSTIWEKSFESNSHGVTWDLSGETASKVYVSPEVGVLVAGVAGPYMEAVPYLGFNGNISLSDQTWDWELASGAEGNIGFIVQILGHTVANYSTTLTNWETIIAEDNGELGTNTPPTAIFTIDPTSGTTSTVFEFDGSGSYDAEDSTSALQVRWDWENDGSWDTYWSTDKTENHQYGSEGTYIVKMEVKDTEGLTDYTTHTVNVNNGGGSTFTDPRDGQVYNIVTISSQIWFAENLNYETSNSWWYDNSSANGDVYGRLYKWDAALTACPSGWHLPTDDEWCTLTTYIDTTVNCNAIGWSGTDVGYKMKSTSGWYSNGNGSDTYGFMALPGGYRNSCGNFVYVEEYAYFWSSTENTISSAWSRPLYYDFDEVGRYGTYKVHGFSVRCLKD